MSIAICELLRNLSQGIVGLGDEDLERISAGAALIFKTILEGGCRAGCMVLYVNSYLQGIASLILLLNLAGGLLVSERALKLEPTELPANPFLPGLSAVR